MRLYLMGELWRKLRCRNEIISKIVLVAVSMAFAAWVAYQYDIFPNSPGVPVQEHVIELDESLALCALLCVILLVISWRSLIAQRREVARRTDAERRARELAHRDILTGLANRREFERELSAVIIAPRLADRVHAVLMLDLNNFKRVNDIYGHGNGDEVLVAAARRLEQAVRQGDLVARLGGDEFAIVARHLSGAEQATKIARRVVQEFGQPIVIGSVRHHVGIGVGIALISQSTESNTEILRQADMALYRAKIGRRSAFCFFDPSMDIQVRERDLIEGDLYSAITQGNIRSCYQPLIDLHTKHIVGFEALARWTHPTLGNISPERFISIAETCDLINELTEHLIREAVTAACQWPEDLILAVNIPPSQLRDDRLPSRIVTILREIGLSPRRLEIEVTESALVQDIKDVQVVLNKLRNAGIRIALDDFGTGYSSLYHLQNFHIDKIKIDRSFIANMETEPGAAAIVRALLGLGNGLGLTITAEGVEKKSQALALLSEGCQQAQGYLYGRAVSAIEVLDYIATDRAVLARGLSSIA